MKKLLCMLLVAAMLLGFMPAFSLQAAAADGTEEVVIEEVAIAQPEELTAEEPTTEPEEAATEEPATEPEEEEPAQAPETRAPATRSAYSVHVIDLDNVPYEIAPGAAEIPEIYEYDYDHISISGSQWLDANKRPVTAFEDGEIYWLAVTVVPNENYAFTEEPEQIFTCSKEYTLDIISQQEAIVYIRYSLEPSVGDVDITVSGVEEGAKIKDIQATVTGNATLTGIEVYEAVLTKEEYSSYYYDYVLAEDTTFASGKSYKIEYGLIAAEGYRFDDKFDVRLNGDWNCYQEGNDKQQIVEHNFSTCEEIDTIELTVTGLVPGGKREDVAVTIPENANYILDSDYTYLIDPSAEDDEWDTIQTDGQYVLNYCLVPKEGYRFESFDLYINGTKIRGYGYRVDGLGINGEENVSFYVDRVRIENIPGDIYEGAEEEEYFWNLEDLEETGGQVTITNAQWLDAQKKPVSKIEDGKGYYLAITVEAAGTRKFNGTPTISFGSWNDEKYVYEVKLVSQTQAIVYVYYSLEQSIEELNIQVTGVQKGAKIENVKATVSGNATIEEVQVYQYVQNEDGYYYTETVTEGVFEADSNYLIGYTLKAKSGYSFSGWVDITVNGVEAERHNSYGGNLFASTESFFTTCRKIESISLNIPKVEVGKSFENLLVTGPNNANYTLSCYWYDTTESWEPVSGKVEKKHRYTLEVVLSPDDGYIFASDLKVLVNGKDYDQGWIGVNDNGLSISFQETYTFLEKITKIELPAMPKSVSLGSTLPADFAVADSKNYTVHGYWSSGGEWVEKATEKGIYRLNLAANPKPGYEFSEDVKVYVGGQLQEGAYVDGSYCSVGKYYIVGLQEISKVELTFAEPQVGEAVSKVKAASGAKYTVTYSAWAQSASDKIDEDASLVEIYQGGQYLYMGVELTAKDGYALSFDCDIYLNGKKVTPLDVYYNGEICNITFALGKLGEFKKLATPKLTKTGAALSWETVAYADAYEVYRATSKSGKYTKVATITETTWQDESAVASGKAYYYKVKAVYTADAGKNSGYSSVVSVDYPCATPELTVAAGSTGKPVLTWNKITGAKKYEIWRSVDGGAFKKLTTSTKLTYTDSKATAGAECTYKIKALGSKSAYNGEFSETGSCYVTCAAPSITLKLDSKTGKPSISWKKVTGAQAYAIYRSDNDGEYELLTTVTAVSYKDTSAQMDNKYSYYVVTLGKNEVFDSVASGIKTTTLTLKAPKLTGSADAEGKPVISWTAVEGAEKYEIYRSTKSSKGYTLLAEVEETSYTDTSVATGKTNYYKVVAVGKNTQSAMSAYLKQIGKCAAPTISVELNATSGKPVISWEKVEGAKKYTVYRATSENGKYTNIGTSKTTSYTDSKAVPGTEYYYKVVANGSKSSYNSTYSNVVSAVGYAAQPQVTLKNDSKGKPVVSWKKISEADKYIVVYVDVTDIEDESELTEEYILEHLQYVEVSKKKTSVTLTQAQTGRLYLVCVVAIPKNETFFNFSQLGYVASTCAAPKISGKYLQGYNCGTWKPVEGAECYAIYRSTKANGEYELLGYIDNDSSFVDLSAVKGKTYYYKVTACTEHTESAFSNYIKLKTK